MMWAKCFKETVTATTQNPINQLIKLNCLLRNLTQTYHFSDCIHLFQQIYSSHHLRPDQYTLSTTLTSCANLHDTTVGCQLHAHSIRSGLTLFAHVTNTLLSLYGKSHDLVSVKRVFDEIKKPDVYSHTTLLSACVKLGEVDYAIRMFAQISHENVPVWNAMITGCAENGHAEIAFDLFRKMHMSACLVFKGLEKKDIVSWNAIIASYARENLGTDAVLAYLQMQRSNIEPDEFTIGSLLASSEMLAVVEMIQAVIIKKALVLKTEVSNALLSAFSRHNEINQASKLFCDMYSRNLVSWNAMIFGFWYNGLPSQGLQQIFEFLQSGLRPNHCTLSLVLSICGCLSDLQHGKQVHAYILKFGYFPHTLLGNALITFYAKVGTLCWSSRVFHSMVKKDIVSWNSMISAYGQHGEGKEAIQCFEDMLYSGEIRPDKATLTAVLSACSHSGLVADGIEIFNLIVNAYGIEPDLSHFSCIVDLLGRAGLLDIADSLINRKGINIDSSVWWTLFSSCVAHGHIQLGSIVAGFLLETESDDPAAYVLLSNLYANAGKWEESANLRELMKKFGVIKQPGSSWIGA